MYVSVCVCVYIYIYIYIYIYVYIYIQIDRQTYTHTFPFLYYLPSWSIPRDWIQFPVLYSRTSMLIHSKCNSLYLPTPNSLSIPLAPLSLLTTTSLFSMSLSLFLFCSSVLFCHRVGTFLSISKGIGGGSGMYGQFGISRCKP